MIVLAADTFTRADDPASLGVTEVGGLLWTPVSGVWGIENGKARKVSTDAVVEIAYIDVGVPDYEISYTVGIGAYQGIVARVIDDNNYAYLQIVPGLVPTFYFKHIGVYGPITNFAGLPVANVGDRWTIGTEGNYIYLLKDGVEIFRLWDTRFVGSTKCGITAYLIADRFDNIEVTGSFVATDRDWDNVIAGLNDALAEVEGLRFYGYPVERIEPPACVVALPEPTALTCGDGSFSYEFPLWVLVAKADARAANDELSPYVQPNGERSIRSAIAADRTLGGACDSIAILSVVPQVITLAGTEFFAAEFTLEVVG